MRYAKELFFLAAIPLVVVVGAVTNYGWKPIWLILFIAAVHLICAFGFVVVITQIRNCVLGRKTAIVGLAVGMICVSMYVVFVYVAAYYVIPANVGRLLDLVYWMAPWL